VRYKNGLNGIGIPDLILAQNAKQNRCEIHCYHNPMIDLFGKGNMTCKPSENHELNLAGDFVQYTGNHIFLTGKAGTGKTTFLHKLKENTAKRMIITAPTGVAAINAGGVTLHSFFQLPFGPFVPGCKAYEQSRQRLFRFSNEKKTDY